MNKILYKFGAEWCASCKTMSKIMPELPEGVRLQEVDIDKSLDMTKEFNIRGVPTLVLVDYDTGKETRLTGSATAQKILDFVVA
jgi:thioredoxin 1